MKIILIGMPGCGKSSIGKELAKKLSIEFIDMDKYIEENSNSTIEELFSQGEDNFRHEETRACRDLSGFENVVIASGGGVVKREDNMTYFKEFHIVFINRPLKLILGDVEVDTRPLLKGGKDKIYNLYKERRELYDKYATIEVINDKEISKIVNNIIEVINYNQGN